MWKDRYHGMSERWWIIVEVCECTCIVVASERSGKIYFFCRSPYLLSCCHDLFFVRRMFPLFLSFFGFSWYGTVHAIIVALLLTFLRRHTYTILKDWQQMHRNVIIFRNLLHKMQCACNIFNGHINLHLFRDFQFKLFVLSSYCRHALVSNSNILFFRILKMIPFIIQSYSH